MTTSNRTSPVLLILGVCGAIGALALWHGTTTNTKASAQAPTTPAAAVDSAPGTAVMPVGQEQPVGNFFVLADVSGSLRPSSGTASAPFAQMIKVVPQLLKALTSHDLDEVRPERIRLGTVGTMSLQQSALCDLWFSPGSLFKPDDSLATGRNVDACVQRLAEAPPEPYTDIRGALLYAGLALRGSRPALRGIVLISDLDEDLPHGETPATPELTNVCVAVFTQVTPAMAVHPELLKSRQREWGASLRRWGARAVEMNTTIGFSAPDVIDFFHGCEHK